MLVLIRIVDREVTLVEELLLLKEYEKREKTLSGRVQGKKNELADILSKVGNIKLKKWYKA